jgi:hypothetical protein
MYRLAIALCVLSSLTVVPAFSAAIGIAVANGSFRVDSNPVVGNATLFEGNTLETGAASSELQLYSGIRMRLAADSRGQVFEDRLVLERGLSELDGGTGYRIEARGLHIFADSPGAAGRVAISETRKVQAAALAGSLRVTTADGTVVALVTPAMALEFEPQAVTGAQAPFQMSGCLQRRDGQFVLRDPLTGVVEEARGDGLASEAGNMIEVTAMVVPGAKPVTGAMEVIRITRMRRISRNCAVAAPPAGPAVKPATPPSPPTPPATPEAKPMPPPAAEPAPTAPPPSAPRRGMSGAKKAIIAGVVVGGAGAGAAVYLMTRKAENQGTISR